MNKKSLFSLVIFLLILSLACNLPFTNNGSNNLPEDELNASLNLMRGYDTYFGVMESFDINEYGFPGVLYYTLPEEEIADGIYMQQLYSMENSDGSGYRAGMNYYLRNDTDSDAYMEVVIDIPKEIAPTFDDMKLSQPPLEIINPDPTGRFGFNLKAKAPPQVGLGVISNIISVPAGSDPGKAFMELVLTSSANDLCKRVFADDEKLNKEMQDMCYFNVVRDFKDQVDAGSLVWSCASIEDKDLSNTCAALLQSDRQFCDAIKDRVNKERCLAQLVNDACLEVPVEERELCVAEGALELKSFGACLEISEPDVKNDCIARVMGSKKYCDKIVDDDLRGQCYFNIGIREVDEPAGGEAAEEEPTEESTSEGEGAGLIDELFGSGAGTGGARFPSRKASSLCSSFTTLTASYPLIKSVGSDDVLICYYGNEKDKASDAYTWRLQVYIEQFPNVDEAYNDWQESYTLGSTWMDMTINETRIIKQSHSDSEYFYQERSIYSSGGTDVTDYILHAGARIDEFIVAYIENSITTAGDARWTATLQRVYEIAAGN